jgi:hypothetical protein
MVGEEEEEEEEDKGPDERRREREPRGRLVIEDSTPARERAERIIMAE